MWDRMNYHRVTLVLFSCMVGTVFTHMAVIACMIMQHASHSSFNSFDEMWETGPFSFGFKLLVLLQRLSASPLCRVFREGAGMQEVLSEL